MNFLGALGGIGGGLMASQKVLRDADEARQKKAESDLRIKQVQQGVDATSKAQENDAAYAAIPTQDDRIGGFQAMATEALKRGDKESYGKFMGYADHVKKAKDEGVLDVAMGVYTGNVNPADVETAFNNFGTMRVAPGSAKWDEAAGTLSGIDARTGQPYAMTKEQAHQLLVMAGKIKPEKNEYVGGGDGTVFNKSTGEKKGTPTVKPISVAPGGTLLLPQPDGSVKKVYQAPHKPLAADGEGGSTSEMKNAKAFFPNLAPAEGLKKFRELLQKEGGLTQSSDGYGGINVIDHRTNEIYNLRNGKRTVLQAGDVAASSGQQGSAAALPKAEKKAIDWSKY